MRITLLCNAGLAVAYGDSVLLVDLPNGLSEPYAALPEGEWMRILNREPPYDKVCGIYITHRHLDHCDPERLAAYRKKWPDCPCFLPDQNTDRGTVVMGPFVISYEQLEHAPMNVPTPPHVVTWIRAGEKTLYLAADAKLDWEAHAAFLKGRMANAAFWNAMYLSRLETRRLLCQSAKKSYIYHMPPQEPDGFGIWKKCRNNLRRYSDELSNVRVLSEYPSVIEL